MDNVIITPHVAAATPRIAERHLAVLLDNVRRFAAGRPLRNLGGQGQVVLGVWASTVLLRSGDSLALYWRRGAGRGS